MNNGNQPKITLITMFEWKHHAQCTRCCYDEFRTLLWTNTLVTLCFTLHHTA